MHGAKVPDETKIFRPFHRCVKLIERDHWVSGWGGWNYEEKRLYRSSVDTTRVVNEWSLWAIW